ncbi:glycosyltransferase family 4 protein [Candidatus Nomurabacteria bacterium]|nr:glycosyltransferase family 4 protein [Candidatus Nomurabacteria bacterium]
MKLLVITQIMDKQDDLLGFMQDWVSALASQTEKVTVICLKKGDNNLPGGVEVLSLEKETGSGRLKRLWLFYKYIFTYRRQYDAVFVHMNPIYVVLAGLFWRTMGKKISLWYAHYRVGLQLRFAAAFAHVIYTSTPYACSLKSKKVHVIGQGINTDSFVPLSRNFLAPTRVLFLGRITPVKELEVLIEALGSLREEAWTLDVVGAPLESSMSYYEGIVTRVAELGISDRVLFHGKVANADTVKFYQKADIFVNLTRSGSFDKTTLEAMSCGCVALASNTVFQEIFPQKYHSILLFKQSDVNSLADTLHKIFSLEREKKQVLSQEMRDIIEQHHSVGSLAKKIVDNLNI